MSLYDVVLGFSSPQTVPADSPPAVVLCCCFWGRGGGTTENIPIVFKVGQLLGVMY